MVLRDDSCMMIVFGTGGFSSFPGKRGFVFFFRRLVPAFFSKNLILRPPLKADPSRS
jgi:hypothetical protein